MGIKQELGQKIKLLRKRRKMTQEQLAEKLEISPRALSGIEIGEYYPKAETFDKIINVLKTTSEELFSNEHLKPTENLYNEILDMLEKIKSDDSKIKTLYRIIKTLYLE